MSPPLLRVVLPGGLIHVTRPEHPNIALCGAPRRANGDVAAADAIVNCSRCLVAAIRLEKDATVSYS